MSAIRIVSFALGCFAAVAYAYFGGHRAEPKDAQTTGIPRDGAALYKSYCASCHGTDGKGLGPMARWLAIETPDLTRLAFRNGGTFPFARTQRIISGDENITPGHGTREMPIWGPIFSQVDRDQDFGKMRVYSVAKYLESIQTR